MKETAEKQTTMKDRTEAAQQSQSQQGGPKPDEQQSTQAMKTAGEQEKQQQRGVMRRGGFAPACLTESPFALMRRFSEEVDRMFEDFGLRRGWLGSRFGHSRELGQSLWSPQIEVYERDNQLIVCADLPGLKKDDIKVEFTDDALTIQGERRHEYEDTREGYQRSERSYGSFYRSIPLPEGVDPENAKATFQDGVLKITMQLPQREVQQSRRIEIQGADDQQSRGQTKTSGQSSTHPAA